MAILVISALISAVIVSVWYGKQKQKIYDKYQKQMQQYIAQIDEPQQQQTVEEHYTMLFKVTDEQYNRFFNSASGEDD